MVSVYNNTGSLLLSERTGSNPDTVTGDWKITVSLPSNRNNKGTLTLYNCRGNSVSSFECLGRSVSNDAMTVTNGNTPTGTYTGYLDGPSSPSSSYGPYKVVNMTGISGIIKTSGRSGIWIHGGDPETDKTKSWHPLRPTHGCVRISNTNQNTLQNKIENLINNSFHNKIGNIAIS
ncbi:MAG: L,D-transpeptidase [Lachnospiraceae bacterium]|nr:L,D-transpeptidase [Lachnospiraceae bacterium]